MPALLPGLQGGPNAPHPSGECANFATSAPILAEALKIQKKYRDQDFGLVDCTTFALCEKHRISKVFTFDRKHFSLFRPSFTPRLNLLP